jgi:small conductance mechanosensitive channel
MPKTEQLQNLIQHIQVFLTEYAFKVVGAVVVFLAGLIVARWVSRMVQQKLEKKDMEPPVKMLILRILKLIIMAFTLVIVATQLGVQVMPIVAGLSVAGVGVGLAMQGVLGNLVAGLVIIVAKPFRVGDYIEIHDVHGQVEQIELLSTILKHADRSLVLIPNRKIVGEILHNYGKIRQVDCTVGVAYDTDIPAAIQVIQQILKNNSRVIKELTPGVGVAGLGDSCVNLAVKPWTSVGDFGAAQGEIYHAILNEFRARNIQMPFPQREIRVLNAVNEPALPRAMA